MSKNFLSFLFYVLFPMAVAHAGDIDHEVDAYRILEKVNVAPSSNVVIMVKEGGHLLGQPFQVEIRSNCNNAYGENSERQWPVVDSFSVCDLDPESLKTNFNKTAIAMKTKQADVKNYDQQIEQGTSRPVVKCQEKTSIKKFSLKNICQKQMIQPTE